MRAIRLLAAGTIGLVAVYFGFRAIAARCIGAGCDLYIPFSLLIPLLVLGMNVITGIVSSLRARGSGWFPALLASAAIGVLGPPAALAVFRDRPDAFVFAGTILALVVPVVALVYSVTADRRRRGVTE